MRSTLVRPRWGLTIRPEIPDNCGRETCGPGLLRDALAAAMNHLDDVLRARLDTLHAEGLGRRLRRVDSPQGVRLRLDDRLMLNFSSNDYLGLANHPALVEAGARALRDFGAGAGGSRLICGSLRPHHDLEAALADLKGTEAALCFSCGYTAALGTIGALVGRGDFILIDRLVHACVVDAARLSGATLRVFAHNDLEDLEAKLKWCDQRRSMTTGTSITPPQAPRILIVTESVFSMDGDLAPLRGLVELKDRYGAWLMLDEAHATGLYGTTGGGCAEAEGISNRVEVQMSTLGKAVGAAGGCVAGSRLLIDFLVNRARSFIFSTAPPPAVAAAARAGVELIQSAEGAERRERLWSNVGQIDALLSKLGHNSGGTGVNIPLHSPIRPVQLGRESRALAVAEALRGQGVLVPAIRYPTVARGQARLRLTVSAEHTAADIRELDCALTAALKEHDE